MAGAPLTELGIKQQNAQDNNLLSPPKLVQISLFAKEGYATSPYKTSPGLM